MEKITLQAIANQSFSIRLDNQQYDIRIHSCQGIMTMDVTRDNVVILEGQRLVGNFPIIPYQYLESGNLIITTENGLLPDYTRFGIDQFLYFANAEELGAIRG